MRWCTSSGDRWAARKGFQGDAYYEAANPPFGATLTYYLKDKIKTLKEQRQSAEKEAVKKDGKDEKGPYASVPYPSNDALRAESEEQKPKSISLFMTSPARPFGAWRATRGKAFIARRGIYATPRRLCQRLLQRAKVTRIFQRETSGPLVFPGSIRCECLRK